MNYCSFRVGPAGSQSCRFVLVRRVYLLTEGQIAVHKPHDGVMQTCIFHYTFCVLLYRLQNYIKTLCYNLESRAHFKFDPVFYSHLIFQVYCFVCS